MIENKTKFNLEYVTHNNRSGWPEDDVKRSFVEKDDFEYVLPPGAVGTQLWRFHQGGNFYREAKKDGWMLCSFLQIQSGSLSDIPRPFPL